MTALFLCLGMALLLIIGLVWILTRRRSLVRSNNLLAKLVSKLESDLADRRVIERQLAHMASFADMAPTPIIEINPDRSIGYVNPAAERDFPSLTQQGMKHPLLEGMQAAVDLLIREKKTLLNRPVKVEDRVYDQQISLLEDGPRVRLYMADITELKRLDQLKSDFVSMVSHELRTPLTPIMASIKMIASGMLGAVTVDQVDTLRLAEVNIDRLSRMINDLLDISKIEAGKLELRRTRVDLAVMVKEVCRSFEPLARERGLEIRFRLDSEPLEAWVDRDKILQVFTNLINNALKFTQTGSVEISAGMSGSEVRCRVIDTGPGIAPTDLPNVFGKFQQFGLAPKDRERGTGLGLSLCKGFVELHDGRIWVESEPGQGARFIFALPQISPEEVFKNQVRELFDQAVATEKPLSLIRLTLQGWDAFRRTLPDDQSAQLATQIQDFVRSCVRGEYDPFLENGGHILLALADTHRTDAADVAGRIQNLWRDNALVQKAGLPDHIQTLIVSYPEDGRRVEELLASLNGGQPDG